MTNLYGPSSVNNPAGFSSDIAPFEVGQTVVEDTVDDILNVILDRAEDLLEDILDLSEDLSDLKFPHANYTTQFNDQGFLAAFNPPGSPNITGNLAFNVPPIPSTPTLGVISSINPDDNFPTFDSTFMALVVTTLTNMLSSVETLPSTWVEANWAAGRDKLDRDKNGQLKEIEGEFARRGWTQEVGVETSRKDAIRNQFTAQLSSLNRDIAIKVYEEALISLRKAADLGIAYLQAWVSGYASYIEASSQEARNILAQNEHLLQQLDAAVKVFDARVKGEDTRVRAELERNSLLVDRFKEEVGLHTAISNHDQGKFNLETERRKIAADVAIQNNKSQLETRNRDVQEASQNLRARLDAARQVGAALWQSLNVGARLSANYTRGRTSSTSASWSYSESADA